MTSKSTADSGDLHDGAELASSEFPRIAADVSYFVNGGGVAYYTIHGRPRMALVPVMIGRAYERAKRVQAGGGQEVELRIVREITAALGVSLSAVLADLVGADQEQGVSESATEAAPAPGPGCEQDRSGASS